jgi:hypothetical protein
MLALTDNGGSDEIALMFVPNHLCIADATKRTKRRQQINGFQNIGFALGIVTEKQVEAGRKVRVQAGIIPEVTKTQMGQMHWERFAR